MELTRQQIQNNKNEIIRLLRSTKREGVEKLIAELEYNRFYTEKTFHSSHHNWEGGVAQHSLETYQIAKKFSADVPEDSLILTCLLHDICKVHNLYPDLGIGHHGLRSIKILEKIGLTLTAEEKFAIEKHMHFIVTSGMLCFIVFAADKFNAAQYNSSRKKFGK